MKNNNKPNSYLKMAGITLLSAIGGGILGITMFFIFSRKGGDIQSAADTVMMNLRLLILPILSLILALSVIVGEYQHRKFRTIVAQILEADEEECDHLEYEEERVGAWGVIVNVLSQVLSILVLSMGYSIQYLERGNAGNFFFACIVFLLCFCYDGFWQIRYVKTIQKAYPEKKGDPSSTKFHQQWLESCDEAEREVIYQSSYKTYIALSKMIPFLLLLVMLSHLFFNTGIMAVLVVTIVWLKLTVTYTRSCVKMKKHRILK